MNYANEPALCLSRVRRGVELRRAVAAAEEARRATEPDALLDARDARAAAERVADLSAQPRRSRINL